MESERRYEDHDICREKGSVLGLAKRTNAAKLLKRLGATVTVSDVQPLAENERSGT